MFVSIKNKVGMNIRTDKSSTNRNRHDSNMSSKVGNFFQSWAIQRRIISALFLRELLTRYGRHNIGFLWLFVEPILFTVGVTALWYLINAHHASNLPIAVFALTGYSSVLMWRNMPSRCTGAINSNFSLMYHRNVKVIDIYASRLLLEIVGVTMSFVVLSLFFIFLDIIKPPEDLVLVFFGWLGLAWFGSALGLFIGVLSEDYLMIEKLWHPVSYLLFPLSGAAFLVDSLPLAAQEVVIYIPMIHAVEMIRDGYFGSEFVAHYSIPYLLVFNSVLTLMALVQMRKVSRTVVPE